MQASNRYDQVFKQFSLTQQKLKNFNPESKKSLDWFFDVARAARSVSVTPNRIMQSDASKLRPISNLIAGQMLFYFYDPKYKDELPYYDIFPLVFPFRLREDGFGFLGVNLHYLYPRARLELLKALQPYKEGVGDQRRLQWNYNILQSVATHQMTSHCVKNYLFSHVQSQAFLVPYRDWPMAVMLPVEKFQKKSKDHVWTESGGF